MRLDQALVERGLARSRTQAGRLIRAGRVLVGDEVTRKPACSVSVETIIDVDTEHWVSRAAHKLLGALDSSGTQIPQRVLDAGASTGGFTQVCLSRGAERVYAIDVGHDQLAPELRRDDRVTVHEGLNLRDLSLADVDGVPVGLIVADISFISLTLLLRPMLAVCNGAALLLVKPQFEVGREALGAGGIVDDPKMRQRAVEEVIAAAANLGWVCDWQSQSQITGMYGNIEYFVRFVPSM